jgi:hypothetical protein
VALVGLIDTVAHLERHEVTPEEISRLHEEVSKYMAAAGTALRSEAHRLRLQGPPRADEEQWLFRAALNVLLHQRQLLRTHHFPRLRTALHLWWSAEASSSNPPQALDWRPYTTGGVRAMDTLDATHGDIVHHPAISAAMHRILST